MGGIQLGPMAGGHGVGAMSANADKRRRQSLRHRLIRRTGKRFRGQANLQDEAADGNADDCQPVMIGLRRRGVRTIGARRGARSPSGPGMTVLIKSLSVRSSRSYHRSESGG
jgi:hypothetical protein